MLDTCILAFILLVLYTLFPCGLFYMSCDVTKDGSYFGCISLRITLKQVQSFQTTTDLMQEWLPLYYSFVRIYNSLTNLAFETKIVKKSLSGTRLVRLF